MGNIRKEELYQASTVLKVLFVISQAFFICWCDAELWIHLYSLKCSLSSVRILLLLNIVQVIKIRSSLVQTF